jgi:hypothetical protein
MEIKMKKDYIYNLLAILYLILPPTLYEIINYFIVRCFNNMSVIKVILILLLIFWIAYDIEVRLIKIKNELIAAISSFIATLTFVLIFFEIKIISLILIFVLNISIFLYSKKRIN